MPRPNVDEQRHVSVELTRAGVKRYQNNISGTFRHRISTPIVAFVSQGMTFY